jgi:hypothetical protein
VTARKRFPKEGKTLRTAIGVEKVIAVDIFRERVFLKNQEQASRIISLVQLREEVEQLGEILPTAETRSRESVSTGEQPAQSRRRPRTPPT